MSELRSLFAEQVSGVEAELAWPRLDDAGRARVARGARRGRRAQTIRTSAMATLVVAALGAGGWGLRDLLDRPDIATPPVPTNSPSVVSSPTDAPPVSAASSSTSSTVPSSASVFDDGIADGDLPPLITRVSDRVPQAHAMADWVWDKVGLGWGLAVYQANQCITDVVEASPPTPELYLVSPEGVHFHLFDFPPDALSSCGLRIDFWDAKARVAIVEEWRDKSFTPLYAIDLERGVLSEPPGRYQGGSYPSQLGLLPDGTQVWQFHALDGTLVDLYTWSARQGWTRIVVKAPAGTKLLGPLDGKIVGNTLLFADQTPVPMKFFTLDLGSLAIAPVKAKLPTGDRCSAHSLLAPTRALVICDDVGWDVDLTGGRAPRPYDGVVYYWPYEPGDLRVASPFELVDATATAGTSFYYTATSPRQLVLGPSQLDIAPVGSRTPILAARVAFTPHSLGDGCYGIVGYSQDENGVASDLVYLFDPATGRVSPVVPLKLDTGQWNRLAGWSWAEVG